MEKNGSASGSAPTLKDLYPDFSEEKLKEAEENLNRYLEIALRTYERIKSDPETYAQFKALTVQKRAAKISDERSNPQQKD